MNIIFDVTDTPLDFISDRSSDFTKSRALAFVRCKIASQVLPESYHEDLTLRAATPPSHTRSVVIVDGCAAGNMMGDRLCVGSFLSLSRMSCISSRHRDKGVKRVNRERAPYMILRR